VKDDIIMQVGRIADKKIEDREQEDVKRKKKKNNTSLLTHRNPTKKNKKTNYKIMGKNYLLLRSWGRGP